MKMTTKRLSITSSHGTVHGKWPRGPVVQRHQRLSVAQSGRGPAPSGSDDLLKNLDLKSLNDLPLTKLSETANAVWERIRASGLNVKVNPSPFNSQFPKLVPGAKTHAVPTSNGSPRTPDNVSDLAISENSGIGKEQRLMAALAQAQEEKRQLADRAELLGANLSMLEDENAKMAREVEFAEAGRANALKLRDMLLEERDSLAAQLKEAQDELRRTSEGMAVREGALEALRQSQRQLQDELKDAVARLQAVDKSTEELRSQMASLEGSRTTAARERDDLASHLRDLMGRVEQLSGLFSGELIEPNGAMPAGAAAAAAYTASSGGEGELSVAGAAAQLEQLRATTEGAFAALRVARDELGVLRSENQHLAQRAENLTSSNRELAAMAVALKQQVAEARNEADEQRREATELRNREAALKMELTKAVSGRHAAEAAVVAAEAQRDELLTALAQLTAIRDAAAAAGLGLVELAKIAVQLTTLKEQLAGSRASEGDLKRRLAAAEVALLDSHRAAIANEARLASELEAARRSAAELRSALHARTLATQASRRAGVLPERADGQFTNINRFWVPADILFDFVKAVAAREVALVEAKGFLNISVRGGFSISMHTCWAKRFIFRATGRQCDVLRQRVTSLSFEIGGGAVAYPQQVISSQLLYSCR
ncbi:hypothetical protein Vretimale_7994 [Volvox reticuliferus]|uniref:Uncharacterized protein n=2 Tax=Volvox reticuliferus TaxID=1737510 RepID=A0A8J4GA86_9CHLO|nr:hypothetical protein Vretimale_7994 [Volvox reticuliferus]